MSVALNELKKVVRSLLISVKSDAIPLRQLESMYEEIEGRKIPLHGHASLWTLLTSMSDTVYTVSACSLLLPFFLYEFHNIFLIKNNRKCIMANWCSTQSKHKTQNIFRTWWQNSGYNDHGKCNFWHNSITITIHRIFIDKSYLNKIQIYSFT